MLVVSLSRGLAPPDASVGVGAAAAVHAERHFVVRGFPAVEGKNCAAQLALDCGLNLVLVEDDIVVPPDVWRRVSDNILGPVQVATTRCRDGSLNSRFASDGTVLSSGTPFVTIPCAYLLFLGKPVFRAVDCGILPSGEVYPRGENPHGHNSDTYFWYRVRRLEPRPQIEVIGEVTHLLHPLNRERHDLEHPCEVTVA